MIEEIEKLINEKNLSARIKDGILICQVKDKSIGIDLASSILEEVCGQDTVLYLSGGSTPGDLYKKIAKDKKVNLGACAMVDERFGAKYHARSNELMIKNTGILDYFESAQAPFFPILRDKSSRTEAASKYSSALLDLRKKYQKNIGILGLGADGHTAGVPAIGRISIEIPQDKIYKSHEPAVEYFDKNGTYGERVTMSFDHLSKLDLMLVLVFGEDKKQALEAVFREGSEIDVPGRFYKRSDIANKTVFITDQVID